MEDVYVYKFYEEDNKSVESPSFTDEDGKPLKSVAKEVEGGNKRQFKNCKCKLFNQEHFPKCKKKRKKKKKPFIIRKYFCSSVENIKMTCRTGKECKHYGNAIIDRDILTPEEHLNYLAKPKYVVNRNYPYYCQPPQQQNQHCYYEKRYPLPATSRIRQLSIPPQKTLINTMLQYGDKLSRRQKMNLNNLLAPPKFTTIKNAMRIIRQDKRIKRSYRLRCLREVERIKKKIKMLRAEHIRQLLCALSEVLKDFLMDEREQVDPQTYMELEPLTNVVLRNMANLLCIPKPSMESDNFLDKFVINVARNVTILVNNFLQNSGFQLFKRNQENKQHTKPGVCPCICTVDRNICGDMEGNIDHGSSSSSSLSETEDDEDDAMNEFQYEEEETFVDEKHEDSKSTPISAIKETDEVNQVNDLDEEEVET